jgi:hypothetical protein
MHYDHIHQLHNHRTIVSSAYTKILLLRSHESHTTKPSTTRDLYNVAGHVGTPVKHIRILWRVCSRRTSGHVPYSKFARNQKAYTRSYMHEVIIIITCCYSHTCILKSFKEKLADKTWTPLKIMNAKKKTATKIAENEFCHKRVSVIDNNSVFKHCILYRPHET